MGDAKQRWLVGIGVFWVLYVVYALTTPTEVQGVDQGKAALIRIVIATGWLAVAAGLLHALAGGPPRQLSRGLSDSAPSDLVFLVRVRRR